MSTQRTRLLRSTLLVAALAALAPIASAGCAVDPNGDGASEEIGQTSQAIYSGWTAYTSEESSPVVCDGSSVVGAVQCSGSYCDNVRVNCVPTGSRRGDSYWSPPFSEEGVNYKFCNANYWVTGVACTGRYCDNVSLQCSRLLDATPRNCYWTGWFSEENSGLLNFGNGYYARGAQCSGRYCDNKRFYVCER